MPADERDVGATPGRAAARTAPKTGRVPISPVEFELDPSAVAAARETVRRAWRYEEVDAVPFTVDLYPAVDETVRDVLQDDEAWFSCGVRRIERSLRTIGRDYIPVFEPPWTAYYTVPAMLGAQLWWEEDADAWPAVKTPLAADAGALYGLPEPDARQAAHIPRSLARLRTAAACLPPEVAIGGMDMMSPFGDVMSITEQTRFFMALKRDPEAVHHACELITRLQIGLQDAAVEAVGDPGRLAGMTNWAIWRPEEGRVLVTDDIAGLLSPRVYREFDQPYGDRLIARYGGGLRHVCGPHPSAEFYMSDEPRTCGLNCAWRFSEDQLPALRDAFGRHAEERLGRRGHLEIMFERDMALDYVVASFRRLVEELAPDVLALPYCQVAAKSVSDEEVARFARDMRLVARDYARRMRWV
jgi:hypothetical protein